MKPGTLKLWQSPTVCWSGCILFGALTFIWQVVDVKPYPNMHRDYFIGTVVFGAASLLFLFLALRARRRTGP
jgi:hypothetical protein